jgi:glycine cleavage system H lipoate-binding protein
MEALLGFGESLVVLIVGLAARFVVALAVLALLVVPILIVFEGVKSYRRVHDRVLGLGKAGRVPWATGLFYAAGHTWVKDMGEKVLRVGIDGFFGLLFPRMDSIRLVAPGTIVYRGQALAEIGYGARRATIAAPVDGLVLAFNPVLSRHPDLARRDSYRRGWLATIEPLNREYSTYKTGSVAQAWLEEEDARLGRFMEHQLGVAVADGGEFVRPPLTLLSTDQWKDLNRQFLGTDPPVDSE